MKKILLAAGVFLLALNISFSLVYNYRLNEILSQPQSVFNGISDSITVRKHPPIGENFILWGLSFLPVKQFRSYEFLNFRRAFRGGSGRCSQNALLVSGAYDYMGYETDIIALGGHVVAAVDGKIMDAGFETVLPFDIDYASKHLDEVAAAYRKAGVNEKTAERIGRLYAFPNKTYESNFAYRPKLYLFMQAVYFLKWVLPLLFTGFGLALPEGRRFPRNHALSRLAQRLVFKPVRSVGVLTHAAAVVFFVILVIALEPDNL